MPSGLGLILFLLITSSSILSRAHVCHFEREDGDHFSAPNVKITSNTLVLVTHADRVFDGREVAKVGIDQAVAIAKRNSFQVVYLLKGFNQGTFEDQYYGDCRPDYVVVSNSGGFVFTVPSNHVITVGGHWQACQKDSLFSLLEQWSQRRGHFRITYPMKGIYIFPHIATTKDSYYGAMMRYLSKVNPEGEGFKEKLNLAEMMSLIPNNFQKVEYLKRMTPPRSLGNQGYDPLRDIPEDFELRLELNGKLVDILRLGKKPAGASITFSYVDSLDNVDTR